MSMLCNLVIEVDQVGRKRFQSAYDRTYVDPGIDASQSDADPGAVQEFKEECDINNIMAGLQRSGSADWLQRIPGTYEDVTGLDFQTCMDTQLRAQEAFDALPSSIRDRFQNNPVAFLDFVHDPANAEEMLRLGLRDAPSDPPAPPAPASGA